MNNFIRYIFFLFIIVNNLCISKIYCQIFSQEWAKTYNGPANSWDEAEVLAIDHQNNIIVSGITTGTTPTTYYNFDILTIKYAPNGDTLWTAIYASDSNRMDELKTMVIDDDDNIYILGSVNNNTTGITNMVLLKYNTDGVRQWLKYVESPEYSYEPIGLKCFGNALYLAGNGGYYNAQKIWVFKFNTNGDSLWTANYENPNGTDASGASVAIDCSGNFYVAGSIADNPFSDFITIKFDILGDTLWTKSYKGQANTFDFVNAITCDANNNVYITGLSEAEHDSTVDGDIATIKYDSAGNQQWIYLYDGGFGGEWPVDIVVDNEKNVIFTGWSIYSEDSISVIKSCVTVKLNENGNELWTTRYTGNYYYFNDPSSIRIHQNGNILVTGRLGISDSTSNWYLITLNGINGDTLGVATYGGNGALTHIDAPRYMAIAPDSSIYICGFTSVLSNDWDFTTVKYTYSPLGISKIINTFECSIYPNPSNGKINIRIPSEIKCYDYNISTVNGISIVNKTGITSKIIDLSAIPNGLYMITIYYSQKSYSQKIIKY